MLRSHIESELWFKKDYPVKRKEISQELLSSISRKRGIMLEAQIGPSVDFLPFYFLELGNRRGMAVARIKVRNQGPEGLTVKGTGTGFLIAPHLLLTNNHVLESPEDCRHSIAQFNYQMDYKGQELSPDDWSLDPDRLFITSPFKDLDFTIIAVKAKDTGDAGIIYNSIPLRASNAKVEAGESVNIIQHPAGRYKEVVLHESRVVAFMEGGFVHYTADTLTGSSGSPVFNNQWDVVALHHRGVIQRDTNGNPVMEGKDYKFDANEGIRISEIVSYLKSDRVPPRIHQEIQAYLYE